MNSSSSKEKNVALLSCHSYDRAKLKDKINTLLGGLSFSVSNGSEILLKPNLVSGKFTSQLACTNIDFVTVAAEWLLDHGARVKIGDSPAFGSATQVMAAIGLKKQLEKLPVSLIDFKTNHKVSLDCGISIGVAAEVFECDQMINLPKLKAHNQMLVSLGVKNLFGAVLGCRKALAHMRYGERDNIFPSLLVDLIAVLPTGVTILDGIMGMHKQGPIKGDPYPAGIIGASRNPVALDNAIMMAIGADALLNPLWQECLRRKLPGTIPDSLNYPFLTPEQVAIQDFILPSQLDPVRFCISNFLKNAVIKIINLCKNSDKNIMI